MVGPAGKLALVAVGVAGAAGIAYALYRPGGNSSPPPSGVSVNFIAPDAPTLYTLDGSEIPNGIQLIAPGTHQVSVPPIVSRAPIAYYEFAGWTVTGGVTVSSPTSASTPLETVVVTGAGSIYAAYTEHILLKHPAM